MSGTVGGQRPVGVTIAEAARRLGLTIEAVRKRAQRGTLPAYKDDERWFIVLDDVRDGMAPVQDDSRDSGRDGVQDIVQDNRGPIEATYRVAGEGESVALVPLDRMLAQVQGLAEELTALARRNEGLALEVGQLRERAAGQADTIAELRRQRDKDREREREALAELRRRAKVAEAEADALRLRLAEVSVTPLVVVAGQDAMEASHASETTPEAIRASQGFWRRLRRAWRGG